MDLLEATCPPLNGSRKSSDSGQASSLRSPRFSPPSDHPSTNEADQRWGGGLPLPCHASSVDAGVPLGPLSSTHHHSGVAAWLGRVHQGLVPSFHLTSDLLTPLSLHQPIPTAVHPMAMNYLAMDLFTKSLHLRHHFSTI